MNQRLNELRGMLNQQELKHVTQEQLVDALRLISAHHNLEAIVLCMRRLFELQRKFNDLLDHPIEDLSDRLKILMRISLLEFADEHFQRSHLPNESRTPLYPCSWNSPICDLLLQNPHDETKQQEFEEVLSWFVWVSIRYHEKELRPERYEKYLLSDNGLPMLSESNYTKRLTAAARHIRDLADPDKAEELTQLLSIGLRRSDEGGRELGNIARRLNGLGPKAPIPKVRFGNQSDEEYELLNAKLEAVRKYVPSPMRYLWRVMWVPGTGGRSSPSHVSRQNSEARKFFAGRVRRYGESIAVAFDVGDNLVIDVSPVPESSKEPPLPKDAVAEYSDDDLPSPEPNYQLVYEESGDLIQGYYAAKGVQYAIEYQNAQLPWTQHRLSQEAIFKLVRHALVHQPLDLGFGPTKAAIRDDISKRAGKVLVGLSLVTGRPIDELARTHLFKDFVGGFSKAAVKIDLTSSTICIKAGAPKLSDKAREKFSESKIFCQHGEWLSIRLPPFLKTLLGDGGWLEGKHLNSKSYRKAAHDLIAKLPSGYGYSRAGIRDALVFELLHRHKGDLGIVKLITDRHGFNYSNLIHYASYPSSDASDNWADAAASMLGENAGSLSTVDTDLGEDFFGNEKVGTPDAIDPIVLKEQIQKVQERLELRFVEEDGIRVFNLMTLYTLLWLNLATGSRGRVNPSPVAIIGQTALISDKRREDDSAERPLPLTDGVQSQMRAYVAYVWHLSLKVPQLKPLADSLTSGVLQFQFIDSKHQVINFRPKWLYESEALIPMPGNWARKFIQASLVDIGGRIQNAMQGHWVMGRHPYRVTSNLCSKEADQLWLEGQRSLEQSLGLRVIAHPQISEPAIAWPRPLQLLPSTGVVQKKNADKAQSVILQKDEVEDAFVEHAEELYNAICGTDEKIPGAVISLILTVCKAYSDDLKREMQVAKDCCEYVRRKWKVGIYVNRPRRQFQKDWLIKRNAIVNLAFLQDRLLPKFESELAHLPPPDEDQHQIARFVMVLMWRQGLTTWPVIYQFIEALLEDGVKASASLRYVSVTIRCSRNGAPMQRLIYLEPYTAIYLAAEAKRLKVALAPIAKLLPAQRRPKCQGLLAAYVTELAEFKTTNLLTTVLQAAQQYHLLNGVPLLAAYAAGEFETHDLPELELRRLLGLPRVAEHEVPNVTVGIQGPRGTSALADTDVPRGSNPVHELATIRSPDLNGRLGRIRQIAEKGYRTKLLGNFSIWLHHKELQFDKNKLPVSEKQRYQGIVEVVGYSLFGFCTEPVNTFVVDEALLGQIYDGYTELEHNVPAQVPFDLFRKYLRKQSTVTGLKAMDIVVGDVEPGQLQGVMRKLVLPTHQAQVIDALQSARSGIGSVEARESAACIVNLVGTYGLRRTEALNLRSTDVQTNLVRVQPYGDHRLKTGWSVRNLPIEYADDELKTWLMQANSNTTSQIVSPTAKTDGSQFFDPLNKLVQAVTGDRESHLHIFRHTVASQLLLSMVKPAVDYEALKPDFPWLDQLLIPTERIEVLLGNEGWSGHGIQAISAMLGHSHTTTTLRYYIHTVGIAYLAYLRTLPPIDLDRAFEYRIKSPATMRRRQRQWRDDIVGLSFDDQQHHIYTVLKQIIDPDREQLDPNFEGFRNPADVAEEALKVSPREIYFERFERLHSVLLEQSPNEGVEDLDAIRTAIQNLSMLETSKRGSNKPRHPLITVDGQLLPKALPARTPTKAAAIFCDYLEELRINNVEQLEWLVDLWRDNAQRKVATVRLSEEQLSLWNALPVTESVKPIVDSNKPTGKRAKPKGEERREHYGRLTVFDEDGSQLTRASSGVRWVMTWLCATTISAG